MILGADWVLPVDGEPIAGGAVRVEGGEIAEASAGPEPDERFAGCAILPGLVNAHTHLEYAGMSGFGDGQPFDGWIADHIRRRDGLGHDDYLAQAREGVAESLAGGVTTVADCCYAGTVADAAARDRHARDRLPRGVLAARRVRACRSSGGWTQLQPRPLVTAGISPHAPYTVDLDDYRRWIGLARERGMPVATHLLEGNAGRAPGRVLPRRAGPRHGA